MSSKVTYRIPRNELPVADSFHESRSLSSKQVSCMHRIAMVCCQRIIQMVNNTGMTLQHTHVRTMEEVLAYVRGVHHDNDLPGDRGDFWRRQIADQIYRNYAIHGLDHTNVLQVLEAAYKLERETRSVLQDSAIFQVPRVGVDEAMLDILTRIADLQ